MTPATRINPSEAHPIMEIRVRPDDANLARFGNQIAALGEKEARLAMARAVNRVTNSVHGKVISAIVKQTSIPRRIVKKAVKKQLVRTTGDTAIEGVIYSKGGPVSLKHFGPKQFSWGVRVKAWGEVQRYDSSFIYGGNWKTKKPAFDGHVMTRVGADSFPVKRENGPSIPEAMIQGQARAIFDETVKTMLPARLAHEIGRLLKS